jgi:hypothetical protein
MLCDRPRTMAPMISDAEVLAAYRAEVRYPGTPYTPRVLNNLPPVLRTRRKP